jgi:hypothetical protein
VRAPLERARDRNILTRSPLCVRRGFARARADIHLSSLKTAAKRSDADWGTSSICPRTRRIIRLRIISYALIIAPCIIHSSCLPLLIASTGRANDIRVSGSTLCSLVKSSSRGMLKMWPPREQGIPAPYYCSNDANPVTASLASCRQISFILPLHRWTMSFVSVS